VANHGEVIEPRRREGAHYLDDDHDDARAEIAPEQHFAEPRPGYGTVYFHKGRSNERQLVWVADWVDEFPTPDVTGATVGADSIEGDLQLLEATHDLMTVPPSELFDRFLAWTRTQSDR
jgi:hypothetical protein